MYHSLNIKVGTVTRNTWGHFFLIPSSRPVINPPEPKYYMMDVPGANGSIDLTESMFGEVTYGDRTGSWEFIVDNGHREWYQTYSMIMAFIHGKKCQVTLEDDPNYMYEGRLKVNEWKSDPDYSKITIDYVLSPYKMDAIETAVTYTGTSSTSWKSNSVLIGGMPVNPKFYTTDDNMEIRYDNIIYTVPKNTEKTFGSVRLPANKRSYIYVRGVGSVKMSYRNGVL